MDNIDRDLQVYEKDESIESEFMHHINKNMKESPFERIKKKKQQDAQAI